MKRFSRLLLIIAVTSHFGITQVFAQKKSKLREVIVIEFTTTPNIINKRETLINRTPKTNYENSGGGGNGGGTSCGDCSPEQSEELNKKYKTQLAKSFYGFTIKAWRMGQNKTNVNFSISIGGRNCQTQKTFIVYRNQQTKLQLDCGVSLSAYYGFESKEEN